MSIESVEEKAKIIEENAKLKEQLYNRLNSVYDRIDMKMGLILQGFNLAWSVIMPYAREKDIYYKTGQDLIRKKNPHAENPHGARRH